MADRFPSLDEIDAGKRDSYSEPVLSLIDHVLGQTETRGDANFDLVGDDVEDDFLSRERALLGDDADQFASANDKQALVEDGDDDLLGGDSGNFQAHVGGEEMSGFESSFPNIDITNEVCSA
jgi:hypothetical protein